MASIFEKLWKLGPAAFVAKAIIMAIVADALLLAFILLRRRYRKRYFAKRDARRMQFHKNWDALISGKIPWETWREKPFDRRLIETLVLEAFETGGPAESARLLTFLRESGLIAKLIFDARKHRGWRRCRALVALGRTRAPEGIPALGEGLRDREMETRLAALRGLGRMACPEGAEEILTWVAEVGLNVPSLPVQNALIQNCAERPQMLLPYLRHSKGQVKEVLGRVLGEVATPSLGAELLEFAEDDLDELRAAVARALGHADVGLSREVLAELSMDPVWFVRLRAIVSLGKIEDPRVVPLLLHGLTDANRLVRFRSAEGLMGRRTEMASIFLYVLKTGDRYGLHAYLTALENAGLRGVLEAEVKTAPGIREQERERLLRVLQNEEPFEKDTDGEFQAAAETVSQK